MLERIKRAVVESYIGAIALGYLLAAVILNFVRIFATPLSVWVAETHHRGELPSVPTASFTFQDAYPEIVEFVLSLVLWYLLFYWLYMKAARAEKSQTAAESD
ncbi:MAG TPA: hypothetical protein VJN21_08840 [Candidatus Acidoferrales bacterium]|nr:hypothetical protein [Candidatus Acidoferrales bacterium]